MKKPELKDGEIHVCAITINNVTTHTILLPGDIDCTDWQSAMDWAKSIGGELPTRVEQSVLFANFKDRFEEDWYWCGEESACNSSCAWVQNFNYGGQCSIHNDNYCFRARAVRRLIIQ